MSLGMTWNPNVDKIYKIQIPMKTRQDGAKNTKNTYLESWVRKEDLDYPNDLFGNSGRGFKISR